MRSWTTWASWRYPACERITSRLVPQQPQGQMSSDNSSRGPRLHSTDVCSTKLGARNIRGADQSTRQDVEAREWRVTAYQCRTFRRRRPDRPTHAATSALGIKRARQTAGMNTRTGDPRHQRKEQRHRCQKRKELALQPVARVLRVAGHRLPGARCSYNSKREKSIGTAAGRRVDTMERIAPMNLKDVLINVLHNYLSFLALRVRADTSMTPEQRPPDVTERPGPSITHSARVRLPACDPLFARCVAASQVCVAQHVARGGAYCRTTFQLRTPESARHSLQGSWAVL